MGFDGAEPSGEKLAALFIEDGLWDGGAFGGRHQGREAIANFVSRIFHEHQMDEAGKRREFAGLALHYAVNPCIEVDGDTATGVWNGLVAASFANRGQAMWVG